MCSYIEKILNFFLICKTMENKNGYLIMKDDDGFYCPFNSYKYKQKISHLFSMYEKNHEYYLTAYKPFYNPFITPKDKKYSVMILRNGEPHIIHFGDSRYEHYKDQTGLGVWSHLDHKDTVRRDKYLKRAKKIKNKRGEFTYKDINSPNHYSYKYLW